MTFDKVYYEEEFDRLIVLEDIRRSNEEFKTRLFLKKGENSLLIAKFMKEIKPAPTQPERQYWDYWTITISYYSMLYAAKAAIQNKGYHVRDHYAAQVALGHLLVPDAIEEEDLRIIQQAHKIFEDEYVKYFEDTRQEAYIARYAAIKTYTERRLTEIYENAQQFVAKISLLLQ